MSRTLFFLLYSFCSQQSAKNKSQGNKAQHFPVNTSVSLKNQQQQSKKGQNNSTTTTIITTTTTTNTEIKEYKKPETGINTGTTLNQMLLLLPQQKQQQQQMGKKEQQLQKKQFMQHKHLRNAVEEEMATI